MCLWLCAFVYTVCLCCIDCCWYMGKWEWISVKKGEQKTIHKQREWPKELKRHKISHISIWDRRRDLFKLSQSSFFSDAGIQCFLPPLWILNDPCTKYSPLQSLSLSSVFVWDEAALGDVFCFHLLLLCFLIPCSLCVLFVPCRAITLDNQLVVLATTATDAGRYHVEAVNEMTGENVTSPAIYLSISGKNYSAWFYVVWGCEQMTPPLCAIRTSESVCPTMKPCCLFKSHKQMSLFHNQGWQIVDLMVFQTCWESATGSNLDFISPFFLDFWNLIRCSVWSPGLRFS